MNTPSLRISRAALLGVLLIVSPAVPVQAAAPGAINFQGVARRPDGLPIGGQNISVRASIRQAAANGPIAYRETHTTATTAGGQFSLKIGNGTPVSGTFAAIQWADFSHFLQIEIDSAGGSSFVDMGTQQLVSVPYALHSETTAAVSGTPGKVPYFLTPSTLGPSTITQTGGFIGINNPSPIYRLDVTGSVNGSSGVISGADVTAGDDLIAADDAFITDNLSAASAAIEGNLTVAGGRGNVRSHNSTQVKILRTFVIFGITGLATNAFIDSSALSYEDFGGVPIVTVGACTVTSGEWYKVNILPINVTPTQCQFRIFNTASDSVSFSDARWQVLIVGPQ